MRLKSLLILAVAVIAVFGWACDSPDTVPMITGTDLGHRLNHESVWIIDTRDAEQFDAKHINTGGSVSVVDLESRIKDIPLEDTIVVCGAGPNDPSVAPLAKKFKDSGYKKVFILEGGFAKWEAGGGTTRKMTDIPMNARPRRLRGSE